jgi:hypothetical protein
VLPATVAAELLVARNDRAAVLVGRCAVYPEGFEFDVRVLAADDEVGLDPSLNGVYQRPGDWPRRDLPNDAEVRRRVRRRAQGNERRARQPL